MCGGAHMQSDLAAFETLPTVSGWNFSFLMYFWMFLMIFSGMLSLSYVWEGGGRGGGGEV